MPMVKQELLDGRQQPEAQLASVLQPAPRPASAGSPAPKRQRTGKNGINVSCHL